jgi:S-adenosylmethionine-dependent methyltransferase
VSSLVTAGRAERRPSSRPATVRAIQPGVGGETGSRVGCRGDLLEDGTLTHRHRPVVAGERDVVHGLEQRRLAADQSQTVCGLSAVEVATIVETLRGAFQRGGRDRSRYAARVETTPTRTPAAGARTAAVWAVLRRELGRNSGRELTVLDVGGGTGGFAVPIAQSGHRVTVVDASPDALAALTRRAADAGVADRVRAVQGDGDALAGLVEPGSVDLILCHAVLEVVDDPVKVVAAIAAALRPGGAVSLLVAGRAAAVLGRAFNGHLDVASALLTDPDGRAGGRDNLRRRYDVETASALLRSAGLVVEETHGVRVLADLLPAVVVEDDPQAMIELELALSERPPFRDIASQLHVFARRP